VLSPKKQQIKSTCMAEAKVAKATAARKLKTGGDSDSMENEQVRLG